MSWVEKNQKLNNQEGADYSRLESILQLIFVQNTLYTMSLEEIFFMNIEKSFTFFMVKKGIKSNPSNLLLFIY